MLFYLDLTIGFVTVMLLLSLLIMILVQVVLSLINLRGLILQWGIKRLISETHANAKDSAGVIAKAVVEHPLVRDLSTLAWVRKTTAIKKEELQGLLEDLFEKAQKKKLNNKVKDAVLTMQPIAKCVEAVNVWFETVMNRTTEVYIKYTRWVTIVFAFILAFTLRVDTIYLLQRLAVDSELRAALVQSVEVSLELAERHQDPLAARSKLIRTALAKATDKPADKLPDDLITNDQAAAWIRVNLPADQHGAAIETFGNELETLDKARLEILREDAGKIKSIIGDVVHIPGISPPKKWTWREFFGCLLGALLLGLGAPFWFNSLRSLANLRPMLAKRADPQS